mmetsp:Transcript_8070/g.26460  ORF Transcript_8070/g.26460 Transcript_8070/m.26460 type:complete len:204 (-) Transcript_8070:1442-2053(-)
MPAVALLAAHHDPHGAPLRRIHRLDDDGDLVDEGNGAGDVVQHLHVAHLLPRHGAVLQKLVHRVRHVLQSAEVDAFVVFELLRRHVAVVLDDLAHVLRGHLLLVRVHEAELAARAVALGLEVGPLLRPRLNGVHRRARRHRRGRRRRRRPSQRRRSFRPSRGASTTRPRSTRVLQRCASRRRRASTPRRHGRTRRLGGLTFCV